MHRSDPTGPIGQLESKMHGGIIHVSKAAGHEDVGVRMRRGSERSRDGWVEGCVLPLPGSLLMIG